MFVFVNEEKKKHWSCDLFVMAYGSCLMVPAAVLCCEKVSLTMQDSLEDEFTDERRLTLSVFISMVEEFKF